MFRFPKFCQTVLLAAVLGALIGGCARVPRIVTEYRIDVQQGNILTQEMVAQLRPGLSRDQVRFILGTPILTDIFHQERWDYVFRLQEGKTHQVTERRLSVFFDPEGRLARVSGDVADASDQDLNAPVGSTQVVDLGSMDENTPPPPPPGEEPGWFSRLWDAVTW